MRADRILRSRVCRRAIVTLKTADAFEGTVVEVDRQAIVLNGATYHSPEPQVAGTPVDREVVVLLADVAYLNYL